MEDLREENQEDELSNDGALLDDSIFDELDIEEGLDDEVGPEKDPLDEEEEEILDELDALAQEEDEEGFDFFGDEDDY